MVRVTVQCTAESVVILTVCVMENIVMGIVCSGDYGDDDSE